MYYSYKFYLQIADGKIYWSRRCLLWEVPLKYVPTSYSEAVTCLNPHDHVIMTKVLFHKGTMLHGLGSVEKEDVTSLTDT